MRRLQYSYMIQKIVSYVTPGGGNPYITYRSTSRGTLSSDSQTNGEDFIDEDEGDIVCRSNILYFSVEAGAP